MRTIVPWLVWALALVTWTIALLTPDPVQMSHAVLPAEAAFPVAKSLHVLAYACLTALLAWLPVRPRARWALVALLSFHGAITEYLQTFVPGRSGSVRDVLIDHAGIALGLAVSWAWWRRSPKAPASPAAAPMWGRRVALPDAISATTTPTAPPRPRTR